jgi:hypothetical protein
MLCLPNNKITTQQLKHMGWKGDGRCYLCKGEENVDHVLFLCPLAEFVWAFGEALGWEGYPRSMEDLLMNWLHRKLGIDFQMGLTCFAALAWAIWNTRNKICIQKTFPNKPTDIIFLALSFIRQWKILMQELQISKMEKVIEAMQGFLIRFRPWESHPSDVGFI